MNGWPTMNTINGYCNTKIKIFDVVIDEINQYINDCIDVNAHDDASKLNQLMMAMQQSIIVLNGPFPNGVILDNASQSLLHDALGDIIDVIDGDGVTPLDTINACKIIYLHVPHLYVDTNGYASYNDAMNGGE